MFENPQRRNEEPAAGHRRRRNDPTAGEQLLDLAFHAGRPVPSWRPSFDRDRSLASRDRRRTRECLGLSSRKRCVDRFKPYVVNATWLACALTATDLLHDQPDLARAEPRRLRYRLLHVAARLVCGRGKLRLKIKRIWRWAHVLAMAFHRLRALPLPTT
jgi:hypothetical protein